MWRKPILRALVFLRLVDQPELVGRILDRHPAPEELRAGELIVVQSGDHQKWACLRCPGGCGDKIQLNLSPYRRPRWLVLLDWLHRPTVTPSVRQLNDCRCHFGIESGKIRWCSDSGSFPLTTEHPTTYSTGENCCPKQHNPTRQYTQHTEKLSQFYGPFILPGGDTGYKNYPQQYAAILYGRRSL